MSALIAVVAQGGSVTAMRLGLAGDLHHGRDDAEGRQPRTRQGWLYLVAVQDIYSRRIVGWSVADHTCAPSSSPTPCRWRSRTADPTRA
jgi:transposase InsO family protein